MKSLFNTIFYPIIKDFPLLPPNSLAMKYDEFANAMFAERRNARSMTAFYDSLCYAQVELKSFLKQQTAMFEKKMPYNLFGKGFMAC